ncbi:hypothetical protein DOY81_002609 [Sarcophaga bullata]|nr:hypothetical protein DOY81_002609 [Sarcophaga bullata]
MDLFLHNLPKIELHAHLNGSLNIESIKALGLQLYGENTPEFLKLCKKFTDFSETDLDYCFQKFAFMHELTATPKGLRLACEMVIRSFASDNVIYLELRTTPKDNKNMSREEYIDVILKTIEKLKRECNIIVKLLLSIDRSQSIESAEEIVMLAGEFKIDYPDIIIGIDFSGNPNKGKFKDFQNVLQEVKNSHLKLAVHCAEIANHQEAQEMLDFGFERCGHGTFLTNEQLQQCLEKNITIECCLTSNVKCGTVKSYDDHHFKQIFQNGVKAVLCTDDSGVFDTTLSDEFKLAVKYYQLNREDIYKLSLNAVEAAFTSQKGKEILKETINKYFENNK